MAIPKIPHTLPIVPLYNKILLPASVTKYIFRGKDNLALMRKLYRTYESKNAAIIGFVPAFPSTTGDDLVSDKSNSTRSSVSIITQRKTQNETDNANTNSTSCELFHFGCAGRVVRMERLLGGFSLIVEGLSRFRLDKIVSEEPYLVGEITTFPDKFSASHLKDDPQLAEMMVTLQSLAREFLVKLKELNLPETLVVQLEKLIDNSSPSTLADLLANVVKSSLAEKMEILECLDVSTRIGKVNEYITRQMHMLQVSQDVHSSVENKLSKKQREFYLRQQLNAIKEELGEKDFLDPDSPSSKDEDELSDLQNRLEAAKLPEEAKTAATRELKRLRKLHPSMAEWNVIRTYLETIAELPWSTSSESVVDLNKARDQLAADHFGLEKVKKRVLEYLSVIKVKGDLKAPIICFVGPPGVGKTSLGKSIATALNRKFLRISLGGIRDEADIRGHRRTYIAAMPGVIIHGLKKCGVNNPVFLLDEIDKTVNRTHYGDPSAALLEVLDPEQNNSFTDHYLNLPFDLSKVLFIATANSLDTISAPLLDRMEIIQLPGYTFEEKLHIARKHLLPKQILTHGMEKDSVHMDDEVILKVAEAYTRESGVRGLEREIAAVVRGKCVTYAEHKETGVPYNPAVKYEDLESLLGVEKYDDELAQRESIPGIATGLAYTGIGQGGILFIEVTRMPGKGNLQLTGNLGDVIKESAQIALTWVKAHAYELRLTKSPTENLIEKVDVHVHVPGGAIPKDGPSAGIALVTAMVSLFSNRPVSPTIAMTGEITLRGQVLPIGGVKEKVVAAHRAGIQKILVPFRNRKDIMGDVSKNIREDIKFVYVKTLADVLEAVFEKRDNMLNLVEARL